MVMVVAGVAGCVPAVVVRTASDGLATRSWRGGLEGPRGCDT